MGYFDVFSKINFKNKKKYYFNILKKNILKRKKEKWLTIKKNISDSRRQFKEILEMMQH
jgi:hypothetical protein